MGISEDSSQVLDGDSQRVEKQKLHISKSSFAKPFRNCFEETYLHNMHFLSGFPPFHHSPPDFYPAGARSAPAGPIGPKGPPGGRNGNVLDQFLMAIWVISEWERDLYLFLT